MKIIAQNKGHSKKNGVSEFQENIKESIVKMIQNIPKKS